MLILADWVDPKKGSGRKGGPEDFLGYLSREAPELLGCRSMKRQSFSALESYEDRASQPHVTSGG